MIDGNKLIDLIKQSMVETQPVSTATVPTLDKETHIAIVLDTSGSMQTIRDDIIGMVNNTYAQLRRDAADGKYGNTFLTFVLFGVGSGDVQVVYANKPISALEDLTPNTYVPQGLTPMYDGMGIAISELAKYDDGLGNKAFLVSTFTDGHENHSREWDGPRLSEKIKALKAKDTWTFTVAGANIDVENLAGKLNIDLGNVVSYEATSIGTHILSGQNVNALGNYSQLRSEGVTSSASFYAGDSTPTTLLGKPPKKRATPKATSHTNTLASIYGGGTDRADKDEDDDNTLA